MRCRRMRCIHNKLQSERGASVLIALLFFLVATMVSVVILNAAVTTVKRMDDDRKQEQNYLAVSSAARVVREGLAGSNCTISQIGTETVEADGSTTITWGETQIEPNASTGFGPILAYLVKSAYTAGIAPTKTSPCVIEVKIDSSTTGVDSDKLPLCTLTLCMYVDPDADKSGKDASYVLCGEINADDSDQAVYLGEVLLSGIEREEGLTKKCQLDWNDPSQIRFTTMGG